MFFPKETACYARKDIDGVILLIKQNSKLMGFFISIVFAGFFSLGEDFMRLWVPSENYTLIYKLAVLAIISVMVTGATTSLHNVFLLTNKYI